MSRWLYSVIASVTGAIVGGICYGLTAAVALSIVYGLLVAVIACVLGETKHMSSTLEQKIAEWEFKALDLGHLTAYLQHADPYIKERVEASANELRALARTGAEGKVTLKARTIQGDCISILKHVQSGEVFASSYVNPRFFWCTPEGALYRQQCFDLVRKGIKITRVFIDPAHADDDEKKCIEDEVGKQRANGVRVRRVSESSLPDRCKKDFLLIPGKYVAYLHVGARGDVLEALEVHFDTQELDEAKQRADEILKLSTEC